MRGHRHRDRVARLVGVAPHHDLEVTVARRTSWHILLKAAFAENGEDFKKMKSTLTSEQMNRIVTKHQGGY